LPSIARKKNQFKQWRASTMKYLKYLTFVAISSTSYIIAIAGASLAGPLDAAQKATADNFSKFDTNGTTGTAAFGLQMWAVIVIIAVFSIFITIGFNFMQSSPNLQLNERIMQAISAALPIVACIALAASVITWFVDTGTPVAP
jgi:preprotein translocase subunit SecY